MFKKEGYVLVKNVINSQLLRHLAIQFTMLKDVIYYTQNKQSDEYLGDHQTANSFAHYGPWAFEALMETIKPEMEKATGLELYPTYSYGRIYYNGSILEKHKDRYSCEISATVCIEQDTNMPWDIYFESRSKKNIRLQMSPGDIIIYRGVELAHWREPYQGKRHIQAFLHYVDVNGPYSAFKYDTRPMLGMAVDTKRPL
jgi:hypothetical protein